MLYIKRYVFVLWFVALTVFGQAQHHINLSGFVLDESDKPLPGCHVHIGELCCITNNLGYFSYNLVSEDTLVNVQFSFIGYQKLDTVFDKNDKDLLIRLNPETTGIQSVFIYGTRNDTLKSIKNEQIHDDFITENLSSTFVKAIDVIPGVNSMDIGAGASKPVIRGLGFNRVVVSENGIKQEGQQWGADHGLELDPFTVETAEIVKGPSSLEFGSDAIGGYINILNDEVPAKNTISGNAIIYGKTINNNLTGTFLIKGRQENLFYKLRGTAINYGDYKIPTDTVIYLTRKIPIYKKLLKNTSGYEYDWFSQVGYIGMKFKTTCTISQVLQKSGFFPGAHGIPDLKRVTDDGDYRNIEYPYQKARHNKVLSNSKIYLTHGIVTVDLGYQSNIREEWSEFHTHYSGQIPPDVNANQELYFNLKTYQVNARYSSSYLPKHQLNVGIQNQWKTNTIAGYNYLLPEYSNYSAGVFANDKFELTRHLIFNYGVRYDVNRIEIASFFDSIVFRYFTSVLLSNPEADEYAQRTSDLKKQFRDISWIAGFLFNPSQQFLFRFNLGKAFRSPTPVELASNGIHHGSFRHEKGDPVLRSEKGYYVDIGMDFTLHNLFLSVNPYLYYFSDYIFLKPTGEWSLLPHAGQIYQYTETPAMLSGVELSFRKNLYSRILFETNFEYLYNRQFDEDSREQYPLPFTPPANGFVALEFLLFNNSDIFKSNKLALNSKYALKQNNVARNESITQGYIIFGISYSTKINTRFNTIDLIFKISNLFNTRYFNHINFYRKINIPEPGRNMQLTLKIPFNIR